MHFDISETRILGLSGAEWKGQDLQVGDRVLMTSNPNCGVCAYCLRGRPDQCAEMVPVGPPFARGQDGTMVFANGKMFAGCTFDFSEGPSVGWMAFDASQPRNVQGLFEYPLAFRYYKGYAPVPSSLPRSSTRLRMYVPLPTSLVNVTNG